MTQPPQEKKPEQEYLEIEDSVHAEALFNKFDALKKLYAALLASEERVKQAENKYAMCSISFDGQKQNIELLMQEVQQLKEKLEAAEKVVQKVFEADLQDEIVNVWGDAEAYMSNLKASKG